MATQASPTAPLSPDATASLERHRRELTGYCYRMLGSAFEAEDAVQDTYVRAWRAYDRFEGRSSLRSWLYRIATNVCLDAIDARKRRARPMDLGPASGLDGSLDTLHEDLWVEPMPDARTTGTADDPAEAAVAGETLRLAFVSALQRLPARQRAVLVLREVLSWRATEVAELLETSVASVNSALQRARATLGEDLPEHQPVAPPTAEEQALVDRYMVAFEAYDIDAIVALLHEDVTMNMPPYALWLRGPEHVGAWYTGPGAECQGSRVLPVRANGCLGFGQYRPSGPNGEHEPWSLTVVETDGQRVTGLSAFLDVARLFPLFGLPASLETVGG